TRCSFLLFFLTSPATPHLLTLSLHDALPIFSRNAWSPAVGVPLLVAGCTAWYSLRGFLVSLPELDRISISIALLVLTWISGFIRSEEHTSELQSLTNLVCRLLLEKKNILTHY